MSNNINICPFCGTIKSIIKHGKDTKNRQRYFCKSCRKSYIKDISSLKHLQSSDYIFKKFLGLMIDDTTIEVIARNLNVNTKTVNYWKFIVFKVLETHQDTIKLNGTIFIDETFIPIRDKKHKIVKHPNKKTRGISYNQLCIITMIDLFGVSIAKVASRAMALPKHYISLFTDNMGSVERFIHDGNLRGFQFMKSFNVEYFDGKRDESGDYSIDIIDHYHSILKRHIFKHNGFKIKNTQHYLNFFVYRQNYLTSHNVKGMIKKNNVKNKMINDLFKIIKNSDKKITYLDYMKDKGIESILLSIY
jgi:transposase-like protein